MVTEMPDPLRERAHRLAEAFADGGDAVVVGLLADAAEPGASWRAAAALADASAGRRRTLLVNLAGAGSGLDRFLEMEGGEGLEAVRSGERRLSEAAGRPPGRDFLYLPSGEPGPGGRSRPIEDEGVLRARRRLAGKIRDARGLLLLYLEAGALPTSLAEDLVDGAVPLAGADPHLPDGVPVLGRLEMPEEDAAGGGEPGETPTDGAAGAAAEEDFLPGISGQDAAGFGAVEDEEETGGPEPPAGRATIGEDAGAGEDPFGSEGDGREDDLAEPEPPSGEATEEGPGDGSDGEAPAPDGKGPRLPPDGADGGWRRHRRSSGPPWAKIGTGAVAVLLLGAGWWWLAGRAADAGAGAGASAGSPAPSGAAVAAADSPVSSAPAEDTVGHAEDTVGTAEDTAAAAGGERRAAADAVDSAPELTHSVLVASFSDWPVARDRAEGLRSGRGGTWLVAPTPVRGALFWRLFAGAVPDREAGRALMEELVRDGVKDEAREWDVRPASLAYRLGVEATRPAAEERATELRGRGIPAYVLPAVAGADTAWQVYAGAFESREAAARLGGMLEETGVEGELVARRGEGSGR